MITAKEFAQKNGHTLEKVMKMIRDGELSSDVKNNVVYVESEESGHSSKNTVITAGVIIAIAPFVLTVFAFLICFIKPFNSCLAAPFLWMLLWPAYVVGLFLIAISFFIPEK